LVADFADKILWLLDHSEDRARMGQFGRRRVEQGLAWEHSVGNLLAAYERVFQKRGRILHNTSTTSDASSKSSPVLTDTRQQGADEFTSERAEG